MSWINLTPAIRRLVDITQTLPPEILTQLTDYAEFLVGKYGWVRNERIVTCTPAEDEVDLSNPVVQEDEVDLSGVIPTRILSNYGAHSAIGLI